MWTALLLCVDNNVILQRKKGLHWIDIIRLISKEMLMILGIPSQPLPWWDSRVVYFVVQCIYLVNEIAVLGHDKWKKKQYWTFPKQNYHSQRFPTEFLSYFVSGTSLWSVRVVYVTCSTELLLCESTLLDHIRVKVKYRGSSLGLQLVSPVNHQ